MKYEKNVENVLNSAKVYARSKNFGYVTAEMVLKVILDDNNIFKDQSIIAKELIELLGPRAAGIVEPLFSQSYSHIITRAEKCATNADKDEVDLADLLAGIWNSYECQASKLLKTYVTKDELIAVACRLRGDDEATIADVLRKIHSDWSPLVDEKKNKLLRLFEDLSSESQDAVLNLMALLK